ncbi:hypothetical protein HMPREF9374_1585 [Desmospora sp. 8437]|nr:hypothetical protein HMPREF9374_1585 [Desmospora sp. 8437]
MRGGLGLKHRLLQVMKIAGADQEEIAELNEEESPDGDHSRRTSEYEIGAADEVEGHPPQSIFLSYRPFLFME